MLLLKEIDQMLLIIIEEASEEEIEEEISEEIEIQEILQ